MLTLGFVALAVVLLALSIATSRLAGRACYRIDRDAYRRAQAEWADHRRASMGAGR